MASSPPQAAVSLPSPPVPSDLAHALRAGKPSVRGLSPHVDAVLAALRGILGE